MNVYTVTCVIMIENGSDMESIPFTKSFSAFDDAKTAVFEDATLVAEVESISELDGRGWYRDQEENTTFWTWSFNLGPDDVVEYTITKTELV